MEFRFNTLKISHPHGNYLSPFINHLMRNLFAVLILGINLCGAQNIQEKLDRGVKDLMASQPALAANLSMYVADISGNPVYDFNGNKGLSTASTQKIFTAACVLETLGADYRYTTTASYSGKITSGNLSGDIIIQSNGDPTLGSWRYEGYKPDDFRQKLLAAITGKGISAISGNLVVDDSAFDFQTVPGGWPWNDIGNYYGSGVWGVNWRENQFDVQMADAKVQKINVEIPEVRWINDAKVGGTTDQSLIFSASYSDVIHISGMVPAKTITISGAMPNPPLAFGYEIKNWLKEAGIHFTGNVTTMSRQKIEGRKFSSLPHKDVFFTYKSPTLDKIVYWFLRKSINLYGETFIKTLAREKRNSGSFADGLIFLQDFWKSKGITPAMINFADGSGLSPQNYVSAKAEVQALAYARRQPWFEAYFEGFPVHENGMKMKSGTMKNTKSFAGIYGEYIFSIIINNYQGGNATTALQKVLDNLK